jgi:riboflavin kinase/FMN adenylyltransferase
MQVFHGYQDVKSRLKRPVVTIGNFDGLHLGHLELINRAIESAQRDGVEAVAYTFSPHPSKLLRGAQAPKLMMTDTQKEQGFADAGLGAAVFEPFNLAFSKLSAQDFLQEVLIDALDVGEVVVGECFRFGHKGQGDVNLLSDGLQSAGRTLQVVPHLHVDGDRCSSSKIRELIEAGDVAHAAKLLGRHYVLAGEIVEGDARGRKLGARTSNLESEQELVPGKGVYVTLSRLPGESQLHLGLTNVGTRPTFGQDDGIHIETHILDFNGSLYGQHVEVHFVKKIRDEMRFDSPEALMAQIQKDIAACRAMIVFLS